jgi:hypothetical protein
VLLPVSSEPGVTTSTQRIVEADNDLKMRTAPQGVMAAAREKQKG